MEEETQLHSPLVRVLAPCQAVPGVKTLGQESPDHPVIFETKITKKRGRMIQELEIRDPVGPGVGGGSPDENTLQLRAEV